MGLFFDDGRDKVVKSARLARAAHDDLKKSASLLSDISRKLYTISHELPKNTPKSSTKSIHRTLKRVEKGTSQMLTHMKKLDTHVKHMEHALRKAK